MTPAEASQRNVLNSVAEHVASGLLDAGYLVYWHELDALETPDGWYTDYAALQDTYAADATFAARWATALGVVTVRGPVTANPVFVTRPTSSGTVEDQDTVAIPAFAVEVAPAVPLSGYELGTSTKWRVRHLLLFGFARTEAEQASFADLLGQWFDLDAVIALHNHDDGTGSTLGDLTVKAPRVTTDITLTGPEATTYVVELNARLEYIA